MSIEEDFVNECFSGFVYSETNCALSHDVKLTFENPIYEKYFPEDEANIKLITPLVASRIRSLVVGKRISVTEVIDTIRIVIYPN